MVRPNHPLVGNLRPNYDAELPGNPFGAETHFENKRYKAKYAMGSLRNCRAGAIEGGERCRRQGTAFYRAALPEEMRAIYGVATQVQGMDDETALR